MGAMPVELAIGNSCVVVDRDVQELVAGAGGFELAIPMHAMPGAPEGEPLDIQMHQVARMFVLVALDRGLRIEQLEPIEPAAAQIPSHGAQSCPHSFGDLAVGRRSRRSPSMASRCRAVNAHRNRLGLEARSRSPGAPSFLYRANNL
jgi:hypothetical protein